MFWNGSLNTANGGYLLWIKSLKRYSIPEVSALFIEVFQFGIDLISGQQSWCDHASDRYLHHARCVLWSRFLPIASKCCA